MEQGNFPAPRGDPNVPGNRTIVARQGCHPAEGVQQGKGCKTWQGEEIHHGNDLIP